jgi:D-alanyl-D-alanine carboxypeptidase
MSLIAFKKLLAIIIFPGLFCLVFGCSGRDSRWGDVITKQISQPDSMLGVDSVVVNFMGNYHIPGMSLAVSKDGRLVYAKGYGYADMSTREEVTKSSLFRAGQISQTITAIAIMKLIQDGKLSLEARVFGENGILGTKYGTRPYTSNITDITVDELLHHTCGGWSGRDDRIDDPKFRDTSFSREQLMTWTLDNIPLRNIPGSNYGFSNFGYLILGRIIEKISKQSYMEFVKDSVLEPAGISDMQIAGKFEHKKKNEVTNYTDLSFPFYNKELDEEFCFYRADACSGWIASATDLLKLIVGTNGISSGKNILDSSTTRIMLSSSKANEHFTCGWFLNDDFKNRYYISQHFGQASEIVCASNGFSWSILVNASRPAAEDYLGDLDNMVWKAINNPAIKWPAKDLF